MAVFVHVARIVILAAVICCGPARANAQASGSFPTLEAYAGETPSDQAAAVASENEPENRAPPRLALLTPSGKNHDQEPITVSPEPFGGQVMIAPPDEVSAKWVELRSRILSFRPRRQRSPRPLREKRWRRA